MAGEDTARVTSVAEAPAWVQAALRISNKLRFFVEAVGRWGSWLILPMVIITVFDASIRKLSKIQVWLVENVSFVFGSTILQELEWHFHTGLFALVLGYGYIYNTHVRVDLVRENLSFRKKAWLEFLGLSLFMIPFCGIIIWFASEWVYTSYSLGEISASQVGLTHRWIIKTVLLSGLCVAAVAGVSIWLQMLVVLWGPKDLRFPLMALEWPEEDSRIEGKKRLVLEEDEDLTMGKAGEKVAQKAAEKVAAEAGTSSS